MADENWRRNASLAGTVVAFLMIAGQVAGKATRDALFLSTFAVTSLPIMVMAAAGVSILAVLLFSRLMQKLGPARLIPWAFGLSGVLLLANWLLTFYSVAVAAVAVFLQLAAFGSILISGFWSLVNERFEPRSGKRLISRIATGAALGGLAGGFLAERVAAGLSVTTILPFLGVIHILCLFFLPSVAAGPKEETAPAAEGETSLRSSIQLLGQRTYLRSLAALVLLSTVGATLLDYVFKAEASAAYGEPESLLRFFAIYYAVIGVTTVVLQGAVSRSSLEKLGLVRTVGMLPGTITAGAVASYFFPVLGAVTTARASEAVIRSSLYRSGYELFYTPIPTREKRSTKTIIDVGFDRIGDAVGAGAARLILTVAPALASSVMLGAAVITGLGGVLVARRLRRGYVEALENSLRDRAIELDLSVVEDRITRETALTTMAELDMAALEDYLANDTAADTPEVKQEPQEAKSAPATRPPLQEDGLTDQVAVLRSGQIDEIAALLEKEPDPRLAPHLIELLAWDRVAPEATRALRSIAGAIVGQLTDALLNRDRDFTIRRRLPRILAAAPQQRSADGLLLGMNDPRFEVRFQCGRALAHIREQNQEIKVAEKAVYDLVTREVDVDERVWKSQRLLDSSQEGEDSSFFIDDFVRDRANRSLEHVFTLLSLLLPREPLQIAFRGLHTEDPGLRGTSLEYLESILPDEIRERIWPFLEDRRSGEKTSKSRQEILEELMKSNQSIQLNLQELQQKQAGRKEES